MTEQRRTPRTPIPLNADSLRELALRYVEKYLTTRTKLTQYLRRKLRERGWDGEEEPPVDAVVARMAELKYVDDRGFGEMRTRGLTRRGYGPRRVAQALIAAGIDADLREDLSESIDARQAAIAYARRRRFGPFGAGAVPPEMRQKQFAAMMRAGHAPSVVREVLDAPSVESLEAL